MNLLKKELKFERLMFLYWTLGLSLTVFLSMMAYPVMKNSGQDFSVFLDAMPKALLVLFGMNGLSISNALEFHGIIYFYVVLGGTLYAVSLGSRLVAKEELYKTGEFLLVKPMKRSIILSYKASAGILLMSLLTLLYHGVTLLSFQYYAKEEISHLVLIKESLSLWLLMILYFSIGFFFSSSMKDEKKSSGISVGITLGTFILALLYDLWDSPGVLRPLTPFRYFPVKDLIETHPYPFFYIYLVFLLFSGLLTASLYYFQKRDLSI